MAEVGRPTTYTDEIASNICLQVADGESLKTICEGKLIPDTNEREPVPDWMPARSTVYLWLYEHASFSDSYIRAREEQAEYFAQEIVAIADNTTGDVQRDKLRVEARKWVASKLKGSLYGDKQQIDHTTKGEKIQSVQDVPTDVLNAFVAQAIKDKGQ